MSHDDDCGHACDHIHDGDGTVTQILPAEGVAMAELNGDVLNIGGVELNLPDWGGNDMLVYVRRSSKDLSIIEIVMARHDGLDQEEDDEKWRQAEAYPLGAKEYWRSEMVGNWHYMGAPLTNEQFEIDWQGDDDE